MSNTTVNYWHNARCARVFRTQGELPAYQQLLVDTLAWLDPRPDESWLDLGCGVGRLASALWEKAEGRLASLVALDCAASNSKVVAELATRFKTNRLTFQHGDISVGLPGFDTASVDGVVSGLAIQYAEHFCPVRKQWTRDAYEHLLIEVRRVLRPGGRFVFSVNTPNPNWLRLGLGGMTGFFRTSHPLKYARNMFRMLRYGSWLKQEARRGRFHYLPEGTVRACLEQAGFTNITSRPSFGGLAYIFRARRPN